MASDLVVVAAAAAVIAMAVVMMAVTVVQQQRSGVSRTAHHYAYAPRLTLVRTALK